MEIVVVWSILIVLTLVASMGAVLGLAGSLHLISRKTDGYFQYAVFAILISSGVAVFLSGRNMALTALSAQLVGEATRHPVDVWVQRGSSIFLLLAAGERIVRYINATAGKGNLPVFLLPTFVVFWFGTVGMTGLFGAYPQFSHNYVYALFTGIAAILMSTRESQMAINASRNATLCLILISVALIPLMPRLVIDTAYVQGFLPGIPRLAGLTPHALSMGMLAQVALLLLWASPVKNAWMNYAWILLASAALFLAQSKTAWISFVLSAFCMVAVRHSDSLKRQLGDSRNPALAVGLIVSGMIAVVLLTSMLLFGNLGERIGHLLISDEGAQLASLTGRDKIWRIALDEWLRHPVFGYGPGLFDDAYRASIRMGNATNAHNQLIDTLARSGIVGSVALVVYFSVLLVLSVRYAKTSGGLTISLFTVLALRSVSEVPMSLYSYGPESVLHLLLLMTLAGEARKSVSIAPPMRTVSFTRRHEEALSG